MSEPSTGRRPAPAQYEIRLRGHLATRWVVWFDGLSLITESDGTTILRGPVVDQAALHGLLNKLRDTGLPLISVTQVEPDQHDRLDQPAPRSTTSPTSTSPTSTRRPS